MAVQYYEKLLWMFSTIVFSSHFTSKLIMLVLLWACFNATRSLVYIAKCPSLFLNILPLFFKYINGGNFPSENKNYIVIISSLQYSFSLWIITSSTFVFITFAPKWTAKWYSWVPKSLGTNHHGYQSLWVPCHHDTGKVGNWQVVTLWIVHIPPVKNYSMKAHSWS